MTGHTLKLILFYLQQGIRHSVWDVFWSGFNFASDVNSFFDHWLFPSRWIYYVWDCLKMDFISLLLKSQYFIALFYFIFSAGREALSF